MIADNIPFPTLHAGRFLIANTATTKPHISSTPPVVVLHPLLFIANNLLSHQMSCRSGNDNEALM